MLGKIIQKKLTPKLKNAGKIIKKMTEKLLTKINRKNWKEMAGKIAKK